MAVILFTDTIYIYSCDFLCPSDGRSFHSVVGGLNTLTQSLYSLQPYNWVINVRWLSPSVILCWDYLQHLWNHLRLSPSGFYTSPSSSTFQITTWSSTFCWGLLLIVPLWGLKHHQQDGCQSCVPAPWSQSHIPYREYCLSFCHWMYH